MSYTETQKDFFRSPEFAVVGASTDKSKWGTKILEWYIDHDLQVTPVHPRESSLEGIDTVKSLSELPSPDSTSVSIITNSAVTLELLREGKALGVPYFWLQPGTHDSTVEAYVRDNGLEDRVVFGGPLGGGGACVLTDGDAVRSQL